MEGNMLYLDSFYFLNAIKINMTPGFANLGRGRRAFHPKERKSWGRGKGKRMRKKVQSNGSLRVALPESPSACPHTVHFSLAFPGC